MNVNVKLSITDEWRNLLAGYIDGTQTKRLATRKDINQFVQGCIEAACNELPEDESLTPMGEVEGAVAEIDRLEKDGHTKSYIRGWMQVWCRTRCIPHRY
jgi:hypothetical protein